MLSVQKEEVFTALFSPTRTVIVEFLYIRGVVLAHFWGGPEGGLKRAKVGNGDKEDVEDMIKYVMVDED